MKQLIALLTTYVFCTTVNAQVISGTITDTELKPLSKASVSLLKAEDSSLVKLSVADDKGSYRFEDIRPGNYLLQVTSIGYIPTYSDKFSLQHTTVKDLIMEKINTQLAGVVVTAKKPPVEVKAGKTVVNVDASPTNAGLNVLEILEKSPGVSVDADGNISLKGKGGVLVLIDGKPTYLSGTQLASLLKSIQSSNLNQIEIMTTPPAKYDAEGNTGIINIKTKKGSIKGVNGNVDLNYAQGLYPKYNGGANINYRNNKWNLFGSYNGGTWEGLSTLDLYRRFYSDNIQNGASAQFTYRHNKSYWHNAKVGADYYFSDKDVVGVVVTGSDSKWRSWQNTTSHLKDASDITTTTFISDAYNAVSFSNINTNVNYKHTFDSSGREITVDLDYGYYKNNGDNLLTTEIYNPDNTKIGNTILLDGDFPSFIKIRSGKIDYLHPFTRDLKLEAGIKSSYVNTDNEVIYRRDTSTGWWPDVSRSNHFIYKENINAAYGILSATVKKWELTAGLRLENTITRGTQIKNDSSFKRNYTNLFPNVGVTYAVNDKNQLSLAYSRRIRRPNYEDLNPFVFFLDSLTYGQGNPYLQPQFSNNVELSHTFNRFLTTTINYTLTNNIITEILQQDNEKKTAFQVKDNISKMRQWGITITANKQVKKWWMANVYANLYNNKYNGIYNNGSVNIPVEVNVTGFMGNMSNTFTFAKTWMAELSGWYAYRLSEGLLIGTSMGSLNMAVAKQILNKKGTIKAGVRDIFRTSNFNGFTRYADVNIDIRNSRKMDNPVFNVSFVYKFGKNGISQARNRTGSAGEEQNRIKSGAGE